MLSDIIRIYHEPKDGIEKSLPRMVVMHHNAYEMSANSDPEGQIFFCPILTQL